MFEGFKGVNSLTAEVAIIACLFGDVRCLCLFGDVRFCLYLCAEDSDVSKQ